MYRPTIASTTCATREFLTTSITLSCVFLFTYTGVAKFSEHQRFQQFIAAIPLLGTYSQLISWLIPLGELAIALLMIMPKYRPLGLKLFATLMAIFCLYIGSMLIWAKQLPCSCGGVIEKLSWKQHMWFNLGFFALAIIAIRLNNKQSKISTT